MTEPEELQAHLVPARMNGSRTLLLCCGQELNRLHPDETLTRDPSKVTCTARRLAYRHYCTLRYYPGSGELHTHGNGASPRLTCLWCKGPVTTERGLWGIYRWTGNGRYPWEDALYTYNRPQVAEKRAVSDEARKDDPRHGGWVVRWIPLGE